MNIKLYRLLKVKDFRLWAGCLLLIAIHVGCKSGTEQVSEALEIQVRLPGEPERLNPILTTKALDKQVEWQLFMPLLQFDANSLQLYPVLAEALPKVKEVRIDEDRVGRSYTFSIREDARWDNGQQITAEDIVFSWKLQLHPEIGSAGMRNFLSFLADIEWSKDQPNQITFTTNRVFSLAEAVIGTMPIYPRYVYDSGGDLSKYDLRMFINKQEVSKTIEKDTSLSLFAEQFKQNGYPDNFQAVQGCGPYRIEEWITGERLVLKKKEDWWAAGITDKHQSFGHHPDRLIYHFVEEDATLASMLRSELIDVASNIDSDVFKNMQGSDWMQDHYQFFTASSLSYYFIAFNSKQLLLSDQRTRRAISHLLDVEKSIEVAMNGFAVRTQGPILPVKEYYDDTLSPIAHDLEQAQGLLAEAGWEDKDEDGILDKVIDGKRIRLSLRYKYPTNNAIAEQVGLLLKNAAIKAGVEINLIPLAFGTLIEETRARDFELYFGRWSQQPGLDDLRNIWHTDNDTPRGFNKSGFGDAESDQLIDSINIVQDDLTRNRLYQAIQRKIYEEQPYIFLFAPTERIVVHKRLSAEVSAFRPGYFENTFQSVE